MSTRENNVQKRKLVPQKERIWIIVALMVSDFMLFWEINGLLQHSLAYLHSEQFEDTMKDFGSIARIALFFVLTYYVLLRLMKLRFLKGQINLKKWLSTLLRFSRRWHTPIAILAIALIILHTVAVFLHGFEFDFDNINGLLALFVLLPVPISGLFRYQRMDKKWHLRSGIAFAILFLIHSFL
ncbi:hypothetical protein ACFOZY_04245 [Chungangia koreensis]|uniref:Uncharacterized protein n=1 Tax=Chungangia koreensis TaxID=752657 RepID=A0ABV8X3X5_9LACT